MEATYNQFIGHYPKAVDPSACDMIISYFEQVKSGMGSYLRSDYQREKQMSDDEGISFTYGQNSFPHVENEHEGRSIVSEFSFDIKNPCAKVIENSLHRCYTQYQEKYNNLFRIDLLPLYHKVQKTLPAQGYHVWHYENSDWNVSTRVLVYTLYLNDVEEGGETEFLYQSHRISPRKGDISIFPAGFTHQHRGNPPLKEEKYIMTGWFEKANINMN